MLDGGKYDLKGQRDALMILLFIILLKESYNGVKPWADDFEN